jgi:signal transduction histidine kinase
VREIIERTTLAIAPIYAAQRQELLLEGSRDLLIWADPDRLEQILINLTKNASEASPSGARVRLSWAPRGTESLLGAGIVFRVIDQGPGMAPEECSRAFEPFYSTKGGGSGLGLSLSHAFAEQHGGRLHLESAPGRGTTAVLELPPGDPERVEPHASIPAGR